MMYVFGRCKCHVLSKKTNLCRQTSLVSSLVLVLIESITSGLYWWYCYHSPTSVFQCESHLKIVEMTDYLSNFAKTVLFENCPCFSKIPFSICVVSAWNLPRYFSVSFQFPQVTEFGKSTSIYLADFFCQLYSAL